MRLQCIVRVLRSAARLSGRIPKFGHVSSYMLDVLHWLPLQQRISFCIISLVWRYLLGLAPAYIFEASAALPWVFQAVALSALLSVVFLSPFLSAQQLSRIEPFQWLVSRSGMGYLWHCDCKPWIFSFARNMRYCELSKVLFSEYYD